MTEKKPIIVSSSVPSRLEKPNDSGGNGPTWMTQSSSSADDAQLAQSIANLNFYPQEQMDTHGNQMASTPASDQNEDHAYHISQELGSYPGLGPVTTSNTHKSRSSLSSIGDATSFMHSEQPLEDYSSTSPSVAGRGPLNYGSYVSYGSYRLYGQIIQISNVCPQWYLYVCLILTRFLPTFTGKTSATPFYRLFPLSK